MKEYSKEKYYTAAHVLYGDELRDIGAGYVCVQNGKIASVGEMAKLECLSPSQELICDLGAVTLMPGLIDAHNHMVMDFRHVKAARDLGAPIDVQLEIAKKNAADDLRAGVTSTRYLGDKLFVDLIMRSLIVSGEAQGPKPYVCGIGMKSSAAPGFVAQGLDTADEFSRLAAENLDRGVDFLKIFVTGTLIPSNPQDESECYLSRDEIRAVVDAGHERGVITAAHCIGGEGMRLCISEGVSVIEHAYDTRERELDMMLRHGTRVCLTPGVYMDAPRDKNLPPERREAGLVLKERVIENMQRIVTAGVPYVAGTDAMHGGLAREASYIRQLGASPVQALQSVTLFGARLMGREDSTGSILPGKAADIIAVDGNPLDDISALLRVSFVMQDGNIIELE